MKTLLLSLLLIGTLTVHAQQSHVLQFQSHSGKIIQLSFKARFASIQVDNEALVQDAFLELKEFMKHVGATHFWARMYPLYVISPENKYFTYPLNRQRLNKAKSKSQAVVAMH